MVDTVRNAPYLQNIFRDGQPAGSITPQDVRDFIVSTLSFQAGISAAGTTQATATALSNWWNVVTTVASGSGVALMSGVSMVVSNRGTNPLAVYPPSGGQIESLATNSPFMLAPKHDIWVSFDPSNVNQAYAIAILNIASLATSLPSATGIPWLNGNVLQIS